MNSKSQLKKQYDKAADELGDWHATFPGKDPAKVVGLIAARDKQIENLKALIAPMEEAIISLDHGYQKPDLTSRMREALSKARNPF